MLISLTFYYPPDQGRTIEEQREHTLLRLRQQVGFGSTRRLLVDGEEWGGYCLLWQADSTTFHKGGLRQVARFDVEPGQGRGMEDAERGMHA